MDELAKLTIEHQAGGHVRLEDVVATSPRMSDATIEMLSQVVGGDGYTGPNALVEDLIALERDYQGEDRHRPVNMPTGCSFQPTTTA